MITLLNRGRLNLMTDESEISDGNIIDVLVKAMPYHQQNEKDCTRLIDFEKGYQPLGRVKIYRSDIDWNVVDNVAAEIVDLSRGATIKAMILR